MFGEGWRSVGFLVANVGWVSGFLEEPDIGFTNRIIRLGRKCRECQVFLGGETCGEIEKTANRDTDALSPLIIRDLNDVRY